jgi:diacylglycerol kinase (ATP)
VVAPEATIDDGKLDLVLIRDGTAFDMIEIAASNLVRSYLECDQVVFRQAERVTLSSDPPMHFTLDGEVCRWEPLSFEIVPGAIEMLAGPEAATGTQNPRQ